MSGSSTPEPIHAPVLAMDDLIPVEEMETRTTRMRERIGRRRGTRRVAKEKMREWGTVTPAVPPLSSFKAMVCGTASAYHAAWRAVVATSPAKDPAGERLPQKIPHGEAEKTCPEPRAVNCQSGKAAKRG